MMTTLILVSIGFIAGSLVGGTYIKTNHLLSSKEREAQCTFHDSYYGKCQSGKSGACVDGLCGIHCQKIHNAVCIKKFIGE
jgi:hypothetical protein